MEYLPEYVLVCEGGFVHKSTLTIGPHSYMLKKAIYFAHLVNDPSMDHANLSLPL